MDIPSDPKGVLGALSQPVANNIKAMLALPQYFNREI
jgi:hypothetical protein